MGEHLQETDGARYMTKPSAPAMSTNTALPTRSPLPTLLSKSSLFGDNTAVAKVNALYDSLVNRGYSRISE